MTLQRFLIVAAFCTALSWAQGGGGGWVASRPLQSGGGHIRMTFGGMRFNGPTIVGAPYSGEHVSEHTQTLSDGTHISQKRLIERIYRDSQDRTRAERPVMIGPNAPDSDLRIAEIRDPVAGYSYVLDPVNKVAHRVKLQPPPVPGTAASVGRGMVGMIADASVPPPQATASLKVAPAPGIRPQFSSESLGTQSIEDLLADGRKTTMTIPAGAEGNDRPIVSTTETWVSQDLKVAILSKHSDPRNGDNITKLTNISRAEPDPALFAPPPDYKIADEEGQFTIEMTQP